MSILDCQEIIIPFYSDIETGSKCQALIVRYGYTLTLHSLMHNWHHDYRHTWSINRAHIYLCNNEIAQSVPVQEGHFGT